ncbi:MAG: alpha/beta fold hydrolase [Solimonas sp.]
MTLRTEDHRIATPQGGLFARSWHPIIVGAAETAADESCLPIVLFHDSLGSVELWREFPGLLAQAARRRVIAYDRLGFGQSDARHDTLTPAFIGDEAAATLPALRAQLGVERFVALGHSVGGCMAICAAAAYPQEVAALVTIASQAYVEDRTRDGILAAEAGFADAAQFARLQKYHGEKARWVLEAWTRTWLAPQFAHWNLDAELARVQCPLLVLHGDRDEYGSVAHPRHIAGHAGGPATLHILADCGHLPHRERPDAVIAQLLAFLAAADRAAA